VAGADGAAPTDASELPAAPDTTLADADATAAAIAAALPEAAPASPWVLEETDAPIAGREDGEVPRGRPGGPVAALQRSLAAARPAARRRHRAREWRCATAAQETLVAGSDRNDELAPDSVFELGGAHQGLHGDAARRHGRRAARCRSTTRSPATCLGRVRVPRTGGRERSRSAISRRTRSGCSRTPTVVRSPDPDRPLAELTHVEQLYRMVSGYRCRAPGAPRCTTRTPATACSCAALGRRAACVRPPSAPARPRAPRARPDGDGPRRNDGAHVVAGRDGDGAEVPPFATPAFPGAGDLRADVEDVLDFAEASIAKTGPLSPALARAQAPYRDHVGLGWRMVEAEALPLFVAGGTTTGSRARSRSTRRAAWPSRSSPTRRASTPWTWRCTRSRRLGLARWPSREVPSPAAVPIELLQPYMGTYAMPDVDLTLATTGAATASSRASTAATRSARAHRPGRAHGRRRRQHHHVRPRRGRDVRGLVLHQLGEDIAGTRVPDA
jgi:hypothetical protein